LNKHKDFKKGHGVPLNKFNSPGRLCCAKGKTIVRQTSTRNKKKREKTLRTALLAALRIAALIIAALVRIWVEEKVSDNERACANWLLLVQPPWS
jgi:hypothetical protein